MSCKPKLLILRQRSFWTAPRGDSLENYIIFNQYWINFNKPLCVCICNTVYVGILKCIHNLNVNNVNTLFLASYVLLSFVTFSPFLFKCSDCHLPYLIIFSLSFRPWRHTVKHQVDIQGLRMCIKQMCLKMTYSKVSFWQRRWK